MDTAQKNGMIGELEAARYMRKRFYKLLSHNFSSYFGEIDLIFSRGKYLVFVEVKTREDGSLASGREFVDINKQKRLIKTAQYYLSINKTKLTPRFDVIEIVLKDKKIKSIKHLENAFQLM